MRIFPFIAFLLLLIAPATTAFGETSYWIGDPVIERNFVLSGDSESPPRDGVAVTMSAIISTTTSEWASYRFAWHLEIEEADGAWSRVSLEGSSDTVRSPSEAVLLSENPDDEAPSAIIITHEGSLRPADPLDPYASYRIVGQLERLPLFGDWGDVESPHMSDPERFYHFTNSTSGDNARNIIADLESARLSNPFLLDDANFSNKRGFEVTVDATIHRWDDFNQPPSDPFATIRFNVEMREAATGTVIPLVNSTFNTSRRIPTYDDSGSLPVPSETSLSQTLNIRPLEHLDPFTDYEITVTIDHLEQTSPSQHYPTGNRVDIDNLRFFHFNGELHFGGNRTVLDDFIRNPQPPASVGATFVTITLSGLSGQLEIDEQYAFDAPGDVDVRLYPDGTAVVSRIDASIPVEQPPYQPDLGTSGNVTFERTDLTLVTSGLRSGITVRLPQGMGRSPSFATRVFDGTLPFTNVSLNDQLLPAASTLVFTPTLSVVVMEETKPVSIRASEIIWNTRTGAFDLEGASNVHYVREMEMHALATSAAPPEDRVKADNSAYYAAATSLDSDEVQITAATDSSAKLTARFNLIAGELKTHFPHGSAILFDGGRLTVTADEVTAGTLDDVQPFSVFYNQACADVACNEGDHIGSFLVHVPTLNFTPDGGLVGPGNVIAESAEDETLNWGFIDALSKPDAPVFAHRVRGFKAATFHMTGHFLPGLGGSFLDFSPGQPANDASFAGPGTIHLSAVRAAQEIARPGSADDIAGTHHYAGLNLETTGDSPLEGMAMIAGQPVAYDLRTCNKFYVRHAGVTGTVEAVPGSFPSELALYGYEFTFDYYGLGFLDSTTSPQRSFTQGSMRVPYPSEETFPFEGLSFTCLGGLDAARLPAGGLASQLSYWNADIDVSALQFVTSDSCDPTSNAFLTLGVSAYSTLIDEPLHGVIGIRPDGELIHREFSEKENLESHITSRLRLPNNIRVAGPVEETYRLTSISEAYFNDHSSTSEQSPGDGRLNFAAKIDVPFFEDLAAHVRTTASKTSNPKATLDLMGGWEADGATFFTSTFFDPTNRSFPGGVSESLYRNDPSASGDPEPYLIHARQSWLNVVHLDYPLSWSSSLRSFSAYKPTQGADLLVVSIDHQLEYLSAENAEISFGAIYEGMPRINLANFAFNQIDEATGVLQAATEAMQAEAVGALEDGLDSMESLLSDQVDALLEDFLSETVDPVISSLYDQLESAANATNTVNDWKNAVQEKTSLYLIENTVEQSANVRHAIRQLSSTVEDASSLIHKIDSSLEEVQLALRAISGEIYRVEGGVSLEPPAVPDPSAVIPGLLTIENGEYPIVESLVTRLISEVSNELGSELAATLNDVLEAPTAELNRLINEQIEEAGPTLERLQEVIALLDTRIGEARTHLDAGGDFVAELQAILQAADAQIVAATEELQSTIEAFVIADIPAPDQFSEYTEEELKQRIRQEIRDKLRELNFIREYQLVLRQRLYDLDLEIKEGIDTAFAQVNTVIKDLLGSYLTELDDEINGFLGELDSVVGAGELDGFAHINGDALRLLRIDAYLQLKVPDNMEFNGYLQIKQLASDGSGSCSYSANGEAAKEVTMGALSVPVSWISPGMSIDVEGKVTFADFPVGMGGSLEMVEGDFGFEAFTVTDLGAAISFGATENYLAAKVGLQFQSYDLYGGVFFGQTCSIAPLELVNTQVATVLGEPNPTFSGAYVYGEAHIPVSEALLGIPASCMFKITAGVGAGAFYFVEGPTYGGQILLAASGEALCLVSISGDISMVGAKVADDLRYSGRGRLSGRVGSCPFCVTFGKTLYLEYSNDRWSYEL